MCGSSIFVDDGGDGDDEDENVMMMMMMMMVCVCCSSLVGGWLVGYDAVCVFFLFHFQLPMQ